MATKAAARRYAQAVFEIALNNSELEKWREEMEKMVGSLRDTQIRMILENPRVPFAGKQEFLRKLLPDLSPLALNLAFLLVKADRLGIVDRMAEIYGDMVDAHMGVVHAEVISAMPLDETEKGHVSDWLRKISGNRVVLRTRTDADIMGGLVVRMGDQVIDASVRTRLDRLKRNLLGAGTAA